MTANTRPVKVISRPDQYVGVTTYTGDGASKQIDGLNFREKPDLVWVKGRIIVSHIYCMIEMRGAGSTKSLVPNGNWC